MSNTQLPRAMPNALESGHMLFQAYWVTLSSGKLTRDSKTFLQNTWTREISSGGSKEIMLRSITKSLNEKYGQDHEDFLRFFVCKPLKTLVRTTICMPFEVHEADVEYCLHNLEPADPVRLLGWLDVGDLLCKLIPLGGDGRLRARFQMVAFANRLWRPNPETRRRQDSDMSFASDLGSHFRQAFTLYASALVVRFAPVLSSVTVLLWSFRTVWALIFGIIHGNLWEHDRYDVLEWTLEVLLLVMAVSLSTQYQMVMQPRMPMLTVRLHRTCFEKGLIYKTDFETVSLPRDGLFPF